MYASLRVLVFTFEPELIGVIKERQQILLYIYLRDETNGLCQNFEIINKLFTFGYYKPMMFSENL